MPLHTCSVDEDKEEKSLKIKIGQRFGEWKIIKKLDEGGFGKVFMVESVKDPSRVAALKAESSKVAGGSAIKLESHILELLNKQKLQPHIVQLFRARRRTRYHYMVITLLGDNFRGLKQTRLSQTLSVGTWSRLAIQSLYGIKLLHEIGYIHRDIKPANFAMGHRSDAERARVVHILDFGMAREFAKKRNGKWIARRARPNVDFRGTYRYCSPNVHSGREQGRVDDLWSLLYVFIELHCGLPWQKLGKKPIAYMKAYIPDKQLLKGFPSEFFGIVSMLRSLNYYNRPDYSAFHKACLALMKKHNVSFDDPYDWETKEDVQNLISRRRQQPAYENAEKFFELDVLKIDGPPPLNKDSGGRTQVTTQVTSQMSSTSDPSDEL
ncbi:protein kinase domain-containing protein [Ditylenchus destructor]|uniref:Protein kinase domain-containing protein n=1 Tax=Ditylenchus destructor TaxID=166010 RepID=A0AAD4R603_9BILA|nr:protein kinase domain-containing protein [Ditylenchus destructor]